MGPAVPVPIVRHDKQMARHAYAFPPWLDEPYPALLESCTSSQDDPDGSFLLHVIRYAQDVGCLARAAALRERLKRAVFAFRPPVFAEYLQRSAKFLEQVVHLTFLLVQTVARQSHCWLRSRKTTAVACAAHRLRHYPALREEVRECCPC